MSARTVVTCDWCRKEAAPGRWWSVATSRAGISRRRKSVGGGGQFAECGFTSVLHYCSTACMGADVATYEEPS